MATNATRRTKERKLMEGGYIYIYVLPTKTMLVIKEKKLMTCQGRTCTTVFIRKTETKEHSSMIARVTMFFFLKYTSRMPDTDLVSHRFGETIYVLSLFLYSTAI